MAEIVLLLKSGVIFLLQLVRIMIRKFQEPLLRGACLVACAVMALFSLLEAGLNAGRDEYFNQKPKITHLSSSSMKVEWNLFPGFNKSTHYQVQLNNALYGFSTKETSKTLTRLEPGGTYRVAVVTYDHGSVAGVSSATSVQMAPSAPSGLIAYQIGTSSVGLAWQAVNTATAYRIYQGSGTFMLEVAASETRALLTGLTPGSSVALKMTTLNSTGESGFSETLKVQLLPVGPVVSFVDNQIGATWFTIRWQPVANAISYNILVNDETVATAPADASEYKVSGLAAGTTVSVKMTAVNTSGQSETSEPLIIQLIPATPVLAVAQVSSYSCTLQWSVANGATYYKVYLDKSYAVMNVPATINTVTLTEHITAGTTATYTVRAANGTGESEHSNVVVVSFSANSARIVEPGNMEAVQASIYQFNDQRLPDSLQGRPVVWVYFPPALTGPELDLEVSFLDSLSGLPEMAGVKFIGVFTGEVIETRPSGQKNLIWKKASSGNDIRIPGELPLVRFYAADGYLRNSINISMAILSIDEIYKELPESIEKNEEMQLLYQENHDRFDSLHTPAD